MQEPKETRFGLKHYMSPTPKRFRVLGDSLISASTFVASYACFEGMKTFAIAMMITGYVGKMLSNFFAEEEVVIEVIQQQETQTP